MASKSRLFGCLLGLATVVAAAGGRPASAADTYELDGAHCYALFRVEHLGVGISYGRFNELSGTLVVDEENPAASSASIEITTESVDTANERRDQHLRSPDFFSATQFPTISFKSTSVKKGEGDEYAITGDLTLRGVTKPVTATMRRIGSGPDPWGNERTGFAGTFTVERSAFGMNYMPEGLGDEVEILLSVEGIKKK